MSNEHRVVRIIEESKYWGSLYWGGVLVLAGLIFAADSLGYLPEIGKASAWSWLFFGAGAFGLLGTLYRQASASHLDPTAWDYVWSAGLLLIGLGDMIAVDIFWPIMLVVVGGAQLVKTLLRR